MALRVLIVEQEAIVADLLAVVLTGLGHVVCAIADTEAAAVAAAGRQLPDLILADERLAQGNGVSAIERILGDRFVPHVFMSGGDVGTVADLRRRAVTIAKPFSETELILAIADALARAPVPIGDVEWFPTLPRSVARYRPAVR